MVADAATLWSGTPKGDSHFYSWCGWPSEAIAVIHLSWSQSDTLDHVIAADVMYVHIPGPTVAEWMASEVAWQMVGPCRSGVLCG